MNFYSRTVEIFNEKPSAPYTTAEKAQVAKIQAEYKTKQAAKIAAENAAYEANPNKINFMDLLND